MESSTPPRPRKSIQKPEPEKKKRRQPEFAQMIHAAPCLRDTNPPGKFSLGMLPGEECASTPSATRSIPQIAICRITWLKTNTARLARVIERVLSRNSFDPFIIHPKTIVDVITASAMPSAHTNARRHSVGDLRRSGGGSFCQLSIRPKSDAQAND